MFGRPKIQTIFISSSIVITLIFSTLYVFTYLSPDQSNATIDQQQKLGNAINRKHRNEYENIKINCFDRFEPFFGKLVLIVIDAFRSDFVKVIATNEIKKKYNFSMPFVERLLGERKGLSAISRAQTPTVTLPKLKTILSGSTSNFIDVLFNLNAAEFGTDNLIHQALAKKKRIIFYGDDTWLQMFNKSSFVRSNETLSFFAQDYTSVDTNVTENMRPELNRTDEWDILILHYLGVDHIGHNHGGINSKLLPTKLIEMDNVVKEIYESLSRLDENYLIFLTGDHGMTDLGNHGGNTIEETNTAVLMFATNKYHQVIKVADSLPIKIEQNDVTNLLSFYLGLQIPDNSKGKLDLRLINLFSHLNNSKFDQIKLCYLFKNALQLQRMEGIASFQFIDLFLGAIKSHFKIVQNNLRRHRVDAKLIREIEQNYDQYLSIIQRSLLDVANENHNLNMLLISIVCQLFLLVALLLYQVNSRSFILKEIISSSNPFSVIAIGSILVNVFSLGSTSFIENEHFYFNYIASTLIILHGLIVFRDKDLNFKMIQIYFAALFGLLISSNWTSLFNIVANNLESSDNIVLFGVIAISFMIIRFYLTNDLKSESKKFYLTFVLIQIFIFKYDSYQDSKFIPSIEDHLKAQFVHLLLFVYLLMNMANNYLNEFDKSTTNYSTITAFWTLLISLLTRPQYLPLIPIQMFVENQVNKLCSNESRRTDANSCAFRIVIYIYLGMCSFVNLGNTNSLSTLDVSAGFTGLSEYNLIFVGLQMICSVYSTLLLWLIRLIDRFKQIELSAKQKSNILLFIFTIRLMFLVYFQIVAYLLMNHLFIWSVITPKLLYEFALTGLFQLILIYAILIF